MTPIGHIAAGIAVSKATSPAVMFMTGVGSHAVMDYVLPEYRAYPPSDNKARWAWQVAGCLALFRYSWPRAWLGIFGALLPDIIDGAHASICPQAWQRGALLCPWHKAGSGFFKRDMSLSMTLAVEMLFIWMAVRP
jgi:hypothetical protein